MKKNNNALNIVGCLILGILFGLLFHKLAIGVILGLVFGLTLVWTNRTDWGI